MNLFCQFLILILILQHIAFLVLEMFLWDKAIGRKIFRLDESQAKSTQKMAINQGLYNGFLALGLIWSLLHPAPVFANQLALFFSSCIIVAGIVGGVTVNKRIFLIQSIPAILTVLCLLTL